jgi:hypothetical protein
MKLALVSTPRSGNTWLRQLLAGIYGLRQYAVHDPRALDWAGLADGCIVQLHWPREEAFVRLLTSLQFEFVTICRHPLDVLLSILHFCRNEPETRHWLLGKGGSESAIRGLAPTSSEFLSYSLGPRADALLSVTPDWWPEASVTPVRYENLVSEPAQTLEAACARLGSFRTGIHETVRALTLDKLRPTSQNDHFWQGRPGLWQELLPPDTAAAIAQAHAAKFAALGYSTERRVLTTSDAADARWEQLV